MQRYTNFDVGDIVKYKDDYYLLLQFEKSIEEGRWDQFIAIYLDNGKISNWCFREDIFIKVA